MKKIIFKQASGGVSVVTPCINVNEGLTEQEALERALAKLPPWAINPQVVDESAIPADRTYRNAWTIVVGRVECDMAKARELHREHLRKLRAPKLAALDAEYLRADELGDVALKAQIAAQKQALRDVTDDPRIDAAQTVQALKAVIPAVLE